MKLIRLTAGNGEQFSINSDMITKVWNREGYGSVVVYNKDELIVEESMEQVITLCNKK